MKIVIQDAVEEDVPLIVADIRPLDLQEIRAASGSTALEAVSHSLKKSTHCWSAYDAYGRILSMFGVGPVGTLMSGKGIPWLIGTTFLDKYPRAMLQYPLTYLPQMSEAYPNMANMVHVKNTRSIRWLKRLGFEILDPQPLGVNGEMFHIFRFGCVHV